jgi:hypothetical protein
VNLPTDPAPASPVAPRRWPGRSHACDPCSRRPAASWANRRPPCGLAGSARVPCSCELCGGAIPCVGLDPVRESQPRMATYARWACLASTALTCAGALRPVAGFACGLVGGARLGMAPARCVHGGRGAEVMMTLASHMIFFL